MREAELILLDPADTVAVCRRAISAGERVRLDDGELTVLEDVPQGHKVALRVRIDVTVPGSELVVTDEPANGQSHDLQGATRRAFAAMERRLKDHRDRRRG